MSKPSLCLGTKPYKYRGSEDNVSWIQPLTLDEGLSDYFRVLATLLENKPQSLIPQFSYCSKLAFPSSNVLWCCRLFLHLQEFKSWKTRHTHKTRDVHKQSLILQASEFQSTTQTCGFEALNFTATMSNSARPKKLRTWKVRFSFVYVTANMGLYKEKLQSSNTTLNKLIKKL